MKQDKQEEKPRFQGMAIDHGLLVDISKEAKEKGIDMPVTLDGRLAKSLYPTLFLSSLGITFESRIENLLSLVRAQMNPDAIHNEREQQFMIPFMVVQGPMITEAFLPVHVMIQPGTDEKPIITLLQSPDNESL
jgi:hypothetical protein